MSHAVLAGGTRTPDVAGSVVFAEAAKLEYYNEAHCVFSGVSPVRLASRARIWVRASFPRREMRILHPANLGGCGFGAVRRLTHPPTNPNERRQHKSRLQRRPLVHVWVFSTVPIVV